MIAARKIPRLEWPVFQIKPEDTLVCGNAKRGLTMKRFREIYNALDPFLPEGLWIPYAAPNARFWNHASPFNPYATATMWADSFNGCSSVVVNGFGDLTLLLRSFNSKIHPQARINCAYDELLDYSMLSFFIGRGLTVAPCFFNMAPEVKYPEAHKWLRDHGAEVVAKFVNPNYPDRADRKEYTVLYCLPSERFASPNRIVDHFKGFVK